MAGRLFNLAKMNTATTGTGTITLSTAASGFLTFAQAGVTNGLSVTYIIEDGANRELGVGTYTSSGTTLTRSVIKSTNSDSAINLSGSATVGITAAAENFAEWNATVDANGFSIGFDDNTGINDDSNNETVRFRKTSSAVNYIEVLNTETTVGPRIAAAGDDTNIDLRLAGKGTGGVVGAFKNATGLGIKDSDASHNLLLTTSSNLSADRTLTIVPGDASRTLTIPSDVNLLAPTLQIFTSSGTWTRPTGCRKVIVDVVGGGGAGGGAVATSAAQVSVAGGGGAGGRAIRLLDVTSISSVTVTIGAGGTGNSASSGSAGGSTSFGTHAVAAGGAGGTSGAAAADSNSTGGAGGTASAGDIQAGGMSGFGGFATTATGAAVRQGGNGGTSPYGNGAAWPGSNQNGAAAGGYGAGGSGSANSASQADRTGGAGSGGIVIVWEYY